MLPIKYLPAARIDFDEAFDWYATRSPMAALRFIDAVDASLSRIQSNVSTFAFVDRVHQQCPVERFPFRLIFQRYDSEIVIVAIAHAKRQPGYWHGRG